MSHAIQQDEPQSQRATVVDEYVGRRIRERRVMLGMSQQQLAGIVGVTYQQQHKYERGLNRISAGRLFAVAQALGTDPAWFFEGVSERGAADGVPPRQRLLLELMRNFALIRDEKQQQAISSMARSLVGS
ncbi:helix-turn-helix transcriptional regulator [Belnapia sp. T6]|uniref:Helix-turn-helix transcriptional regulator n=1 Tax=Belnapia mucosa TaxID=2804532 RepID=A0ABS1VCW4_9PROT|nr:helix-turn-helix transcriptional regulator [Belnapia mucosa]MBL6459524.1 helix-turn-helix transcriptional regulator [Belnapia mucosa]